MEREETTKIIPPLENDLVSFVKQKLREKVYKSELKPAGEWNGTDYYFFGDVQTGYIILFDGKEVLYFVRHRRIRHNGFKIGRQVLVWRTSKPGSPAAGFARHVFFNILLPKYGALISDKEQTVNGRDFWHNAIGVALDSENLLVYFLDISNNPNKLIQLTSNREVTHYAPLIWGNSPRHIYTFAVISREPLSLKPKKNDTKAA